MQEDNKKQKPEEKPAKGNDEVKVDPQLRNYVQEGLEEKQLLKKKLLEADKDQKKEKQ